MTDLASIIRAIETAAEAEGLPSLSKRSGVPYTTLRDWQKDGWRPKAVQTFERVARAAASLPANDTAAQAEAA
jgi:hypothetical protein